MVSGFYICTAWLCYCCYKNILHKSATQGTMSKDLQPGKQKKYFEYRNLPDKASAV